MTTEQAKNPCDRHERRFAEEYAIDCRVTRAAAYASIGESAAYQWMQRPHVACYIDALMREAGERSGADAARVRHEMACMAFSNILDYAQVDRDGLLVVDLSALTRDQAAAISEVKTKRLAGGILEQTVKLHDKPSAVRDLAKMLGVAGIDRTETGKPGEFDGKMPEDDARRAIEDLKGKA